MFFYERFKQFIRFRGRRRRNIVLRPVRHPLPREPYPEAPFRKGTWPNVIRGKVVDRSVGEGLEGVSVAIDNFPFSTTTNILGDYHLEGEFPIFGDISIRFVKEGYYTAVREVRDLLGGVHKINIRMTPEGYFD